MSTIQRTNLNTSLSSVLTAVVDIPDHLLANQMMLDYVDESDAVIKAIAEQWSAEKSAYYSKTQTDVLLNLKITNPTGALPGQVLTYIGGVPVWANPTGGGGGSVSVYMDNIGSTPNAQGATIVSGTTITLQPASDLFGGVVTTADQTFSGAKTFEDGVKTNTVSTLAGVVMTMASTPGYNAMMVNGQGAGADGNITLTAAHVGASAEGHTHAYASLTGLPTLFTQAQADSLYSLLGHAHSYNDLTNLPTLFTQANADALYSALGHTHTAASITEDATHRFVTDTEKSTWNAKQAALVSGTNIKTINSTSVLGAGNFTLEPALGNPSTSGYVLSSTTGGVRTWIAPATGGGITTMTAIGAAPNANGATISGSTQTLQPANETYGGVLTAGTQTIGGAKTLAPPTVTGAATTPSLQINQTWNTTGDPTAIQLDVTRTASDFAAHLIKLRIDGSDVFRVRRDGAVATSGNYGFTGSYAYLSHTGYGLFGVSNLYQSGGDGLTLGNNNTISGSAPGTYNYAAVNSIMNFAPSVVSASTWATYKATDIINQTGGATGITRGFWADNDITSAYDYRGFESNNNVGYGVYLGGTAKNYFNGNLLIGSNIDNGVNKLQVTGTALISSLSGTGDRMVVANSTGVLSTQAIPTGGGSITLGAIGAAPNANAATLTGSVLNLEPASASFGGVVTTGAQNIAGRKTFLNAINTGIIYDATGTYSLQIPDAAGYATVGVNGQYANNLGLVTLTPVHIGAEPDLDKPLVDGYVLSSAADGARSWIPMAGDSRLAETQGITTSGDMTTAMNTALASVSVKEIVFSALNGVYALNGTVDAQGKKLVFVNGATLGGTGTITNALIEADSRDLVFGSGLTVTNIKNAEVSVVWFGAKAEAQYLVTDGTDNLAPFNRAMNCFGSNTRTNGRIRIPPSPAYTATNQGYYYYFSAKWTVNKLVDVVGDGMDNTVLYFPSSIGVEVVYPAQKVRMSNFSVFGSFGGVSATAHTGTLHGFSIASPENNFEDITVKAFTGNGWNVQGDVAFGTNSNLNRFARIAGYGNGCHGMYLQGGDANACNITDADFVANAGIGIYDNSFLGNTFVNCHSASNGGEHNFNKTQVSHNGSQYTALYDNIDIEPGVTAGWANYWQLMGIYSPTFPQAWTAGVQYYMSGGYRANGPNQRGVFMSCYAEGDQAGFLNTSGSMIIGGFASGVATTNVINGSGAGLVLTDINVGNKLAVDHDSINFGTSSPSITINGYNNGLYFKQNNGGFDGLSIRDKNTVGITTATGRDTWENGEVNMFTDRGFYIGVNQSGTYRMVGLGNVMPTTGYFSVGDIILNTAVGGGTGWRCTGASTTGTGSTWEVISGGGAGGGTTTNALTIGTDLSGTSFNGSSAVTINNTSTLATVTGRGASTPTTITVTNGTSGININPNGSLDINTVPGFGTVINAGNNTGYRVLSLPNVSGTLPVSVNGEIANTFGTITLNAGHIGAESALGNPGTDGYVLSSTAAGARSWVAMTSGSGSGVDTMAAIGSTPNANGASIAGTTLTLQPASDSFGGVVTAGTQSFAGLKYFTSDIKTQNIYHPNGTNFVAMVPTTGYQVMSVAGQGSNNLGNIALAPSHIGAEVALGNPATDGYVLSSTAAGVRSWVAQGGGGSSKWTDTGSDIYRNSKVCIGSTTAPTHSLDVYGESRISGSAGPVGASAATGGTFALSLQNNTSSCWLEILNNGGADKGAFFGMANNEFQQYNFQGGPIVFYTAPTASAANVRMVINATGTIQMNSLLTSGTAPTTSGTVKMVTTDGTGTLSFQDIPSGGGGSVTLGAIGSTPNANGATLTGSVLNLEPASASFGGIVTTGAQTFTGLKTFSGGVGSGVATQFIYNQNGTAAISTTSGGTGYMVSSVNNQAADPVNGNIELIPEYIGAEPALDVPAADGYVLASTTAGVRSWVAAPSPSQTKAVTISQPMSGENVMMFFTDTAITVQKMNDSVSGASSPSLTWNVKYAATRDGAQTAVFGTDRVTTATAGATTTTFTNATIPANSWVMLTTSAVSATAPTEFHLTIKYS